MNTPTEPKPGKSRRGFASISPQRRRQISSMGGKAAHEKGTAHEFTAEEASAASRKGHKGDAARKKVA